MATLLIAEHDHASLKDVTHKALTAALALGQPVHILVAGHECGQAAEAAARLNGAQKVLIADHPAFAHHIAEHLAALIHHLAGSYQNIIAPATSIMKNALPRVAALLDVMQLSDITKVLSPDTFERPIYAGNAVQKVQSHDVIKIITVRTTAFAAADEGGVAIIETLEAPPALKAASFKHEEIAALERPELTSARVVIAGGRSLGSAENFKNLLEPLADRLKAALGASRAAVDAGYAPNDWQVGQTGKAVAPDLYIAIGISGAIQHVAGMKDSKIIVAINKDADAPIFQIADYGLVGDLFTLIPEFEQELAK
jgi:electron transfer flavoprotein alpha subunit